MDLQSPWIINATEENFEKDVLQRSQELPVVVDFWATWCGPCQELGPVLESLARESNGGFLLAKVDVDQQPRLAQAFGVQSIPHVFALRNGQLVDQFMGALPEDQIRTWLAAFQPSAAETLLADAKKLEATEPTEAETKYREALELSPGDDGIKVQLARLLLNQHRYADAREIIAQLEARGYLEPESQNIKAELDLHAAAAESGSVAECRAAVAANPDDLGAQLKLADALVETKQFADALELCLQVVQRDFGPFREQARNTMVNLFHLLGPEAELTRTYRRKLSTALY